MTRIVRLANERVVKVPAAGIASIAAATVSELTAVGVKVLHTDLTKNYDVGMDDSDSVSEMGVNDTAKTDIPTVRSYHGNLEFFRQLDATTYLPTVADCTALIGENELFYIVRRVGLPGDTAFAATHKYEAYLFRSDVWKFPGGDGMVKAQIKLWQQGSYTTTGAVAA